MRRIVPALALLGSVSCNLESAAPTERTPDDSESAIVNGTIDNAHPSTVALTVGHQAFCTGTLVTPTVVVTAAHCIHPSIGIWPPDQIEVFFGTDTSQGGDYIQVTEGEYKADFDLDDPNADDDIAVLRLAEPASVEPTPIGDLPPNGSELTLVGFGITHDGGQDSGTKRVTEGVISEIYPEIFIMYFAEGGNSGTCNGDSGGTALYDDGTGNKLVGIHTRSDCVEGMIDERVDAHLQEFVLPFINAMATCDADGACAMDCPAPDPDCPCAEDGFCTAACPNFGDDPDCDPACGANAICATNCPIPDPDCAPKCTQNGTCEAGCGAADPDCVPASTTASSAATGVIGADDDDGGVGGGDPIEDGGASDGCGCRVAPRAPAGAWALVVAAIAGGLARARRRSGGRARRS